jgi:hypothetical protein
MPADAKLALLPAETGEIPGARRDVPPMRPERPAGTPGVGETTPVPAKAAGAGYFSRRCRSPWSPAPIGT